MRVFGKYIFEKKPSVYSLGDLALQSDVDLLEASIDAINSGKQDILVSGVNIKTINGQSVVGSGDLVLNTSSLFKFSAANYNDLLLVTGMVTGDLAYVYNSQGTAWLPGSMGGTYYPYGFYYYTGTTWTSDKEAIAMQFNENIQDILAIEASLININGQITAINAELSTKALKSTTLTINGVTQDLSTDRTFTIATGGISDAPNDGVAYNRKSLGWVSADVIGNTPLSVGAKSPTILDAGSAYVFDGSQVSLQKIGDTYNIVSTLSALNTLNYNSAKTQIYTGTTWGKLTSLGDATSYAGTKEFIFINNANEVVEITYSDFTTAYRLEPYCELKAVLIDRSTANGTWMFTVKYPDFVKRFDEFFLGTGTVGQTQVSVTNGTLVAGGVGFPTGYLNLTTATTATGTGNVIKNSSSLQFYSGSGVHVFEAEIFIPILSDPATQRFSSVYGFGDNVVTGNFPTDGAYFQYDDRVNTVFNVVTASNSTRTTKPTSVTVAANTWYKLRIEVNNIASRVDYFINGVNVENNTTNIPISTGRNTSILCKIDKTVGTTARNTGVKYLKYRNYYI
jgi:hypothetical protein